MSAAAAISISAKLAEPKHFAGKGQEARSWLSALKRYYIAVGINYVTAEGQATLQACQYAVALMTGNAARWVDRLEV